MCLGVYNNFNRSSNSKYTLGDLLKGKDLEIVAASLLLLGKLKVDSVQLFRDKPVISVTLLGEFKSFNDKKVNEMANFLEENGDMTLDELFEGIKKRMNKWKIKKVRGADVDKTIGFDAGKFINTVILIVFLLLLVFGSTNLSGLTEVEDLG